MERLFRGHKIKIDYFPGNNDYKVTCYKLIVEDGTLISEELVLEYFDTSSEGPYDVMNKAKKKVGTIINENNDRT